MNNKKVGLDPLTVKINSGMDRQVCMLMIYLKDNVEEFRETIDYEIIPKIAQKLIQLIEILIQT